MVEKFLSAISGLSSVTMAQKMAMCLPPQNGRLSIHIDELRSRVCISNPLLVALTESLLNSDVTDSDIKLSNYICYRDDRCGRRGGGVILYIHYSIVAVLLEAKSYDDVETL
ncbi:hypothetical protein GJ496_010738 [Pomphorhynchus laevis]|nr:hypothetical protein GJ496_010738 [Pomphorhynchus laevis]